MITPPSSNPTKPNPIGGGSNNQSEPGSHSSHGPIELGSFPSAYGDFTAPSNKFGSSSNQKSSWESGIGSELNRGVIGGHSGGLSGGHSRSPYDVNQRSMSFDHGLLKVQDFKPSGSLDLDDQSDSSITGSRDRLNRPKPIGSIGQSRPVSKWGMEIPKQSPSNVNWGTSLEQNRVQNGFQPSSVQPSHTSVG